MSKPILNRNMFNYSNLNLYLSLKIDTCQTPFVCMKFKIWKTLKKSFYIDLLY